MIILKIAEEFSKKPGGALRKQGASSAEEFYENHLEPKYLQTRIGNDSLLIDLDDTNGYAHAFLAYAFGKLEVNHPGASEFIMFKSLDEPYLVLDIRDIFNEAKQR